MWIYEKTLEIPVRVSKPDLRMAKFLTTVYGGPDGELSAALRYLNQRYTMPNKRIKALLTDIGTEELGHMEVVATLIYKLIKDATPAQMKEAGLGEHYADHDKALFYTDAHGVPWTAAYIQTKGDPIADLADNIAAEEKSRATYQWLIHLTDDPELIQVLKYLRGREIVHSQRFREAFFIMEEEQRASKAKKEDDL